MQGDPQLAAALDAPWAKSPFERGQWFQFLEEHCALKPLVAVARDGEAKAILPLQHTADRLEALGNWYSFTVRPILTKGALGPGLLRAIARDLRSRTWRVTLSPLPDEDGSALLLQEAFGSAGWRVRREQCDVNHVLELRGRSFSDYLADRPGPLRTTLKRKSDKIEVRLLRHLDPAAWADYEAVYAASWKPAEGSPAFLRAFAEAEGRAGRLRMAVAYSEGQPVAAQFWTVENSTAFIHKLAHIEQARPLSPGTTLSAALFEEVIDRDKVALIDFGTGDDAYKRDWMERIRPRFRLDCLNPSAPQAWPHIALASLRHLAGAD